MLSDLIEKDFSLVSSGVRRNVIIFGVDMRSSTKRFIIGKKIF